MYVKNKFCCSELNHIKMSSSASSVEGKVESIWIELSYNNTKYIVAGIYRHPNHNIADFSVQLENILENLSKSKIPCVIAGDLNIDLAKYGIHQETTNYVNNLLVNNFMPVIVMPSRITTKSATIIDHIYYYEGQNCNKDKRFFSGNFWSDLTDHLPNYFLLLNTHCKSDIDRPFIRLYSEKNISVFNASLLNTNWASVYNSNNVNDAYNYFEKKIKESYYKSFKLVKLSRKRMKDKKWITSGLKNSSRHKTDFIENGCKREKIKMKRNIKLIGNTISK